MNSWIVQTNPKKFLIDWYLEEYAKSHPDEPDWWLIQKNHERFVSIGDEVYVWKAASEPSRPQKPEYHRWLDSIERRENVSGIFAKGAVVGCPRPYDPTIDNSVKYKKYQVIPFNFSKNELVIDCIYGNPDNINVRKPLLKEMIQENLGKSHVSDFNRFLAHPRGRKSVRLEPSEVDIIRSLLNKDKLP